MVLTKELKCGGCGKVWFGLWDTHGEGRCPEPRCPSCGSGKVRPASLGEGTIAAMENHQEETKKAMEIFELGLAAGRILIFAKRSSQERAKLSEIFEKAQALGVRFDPKLVFDCLNP